MDVDLSSLEAEFTRVASSAQRSFAAALEKAGEALIPESRMLKYERAFDALEAKRKTASTRLEKLEVVQQKRAFDRELKHLSKVSSRRSKAIGELGGRKGQEEFAKKTTQAFGKGLQSAFTAASSGSIEQLGQLVKKLGEGTKKAGALARSKEKEGGGGGAGAFGKVLGKLGGALVAIGAIAAVFGAVLALIIGIDTKVKEFNKSLLDSGATVGDMNVKFNMVGKSFDTLRKTFITGEGAFEFNRVWGTTGQDHMKILGAFAKAGHTMKEMTKGIKDQTGQMMALRDATKAALTYSKLLGMSSTEVAESMATRMDEYGISLRGVQEGFSAIYDAAQMSGFGTKRFFNMVLQATSGMSMYNVRVEEAAGLLIRLGSVLGQKMGGDYLGQLTKGFQSEDTKTRVIGSKKVGVARQNKIMMQDATLAAKNLQGDVTSMSAEDSEKVALAFDKAGMGGLQAGDAKEFAKTVGTMNQKKFDDLLLRLPEGFAKSLTQVRTKAYSFQGGLGGAQASREGAGASAALLLKLNAARAVMGKRLDQVKDTDITDRIAAEGLSGESAAEFRKTALLGRKFASQQRALDKASAAILREEDQEKKQALVDTFNKELGAGMGVMLDQSGDRFRTKLDAAGNKVADVNQEIGKTFNDLILTLGQGMKKTGPEAEEQISEDIQLAREVADNTSDIATVIKQGVEYFLMKIYDSLQSLSGFFGGLNEAERATRDALIDKISEEEYETRKALGMQTGSLKKLEREKQKLERKGEDTTAIDIEIKAKKEEINILKAKSEQLGTRAKAVSRIEDGSGAFAKNLTAEQMEKRVELKSLEGGAPVRAMEKNLTKEQMDKFHDSARKMSEDAAQALIDAGQITQKMRDRVEEERQSAFPDLKLIASYLDPKKAAHTIREEFARNAAQRGALTTTGVGGYEAGKSAKEMGEDAKKRLQLGTEMFRDEDGKVNEALIIMMKSLEKAGKLQAKDSLEAQIWLGLVGDQKALLELSLKRQNEEAQKKVRAAKRKKKEDDKRAKKQEKAQKKAQKELFKQQQIGQLASGLAAAGMGPDSQKLAKSMYGGTKLTKEQKKLLLTEDAEGTSGAEKVLGRGAIGKLPAKMLGLLLEKKSKAAKKAEPKKPVPPGPTPPPPPTETAEDFLYHIGDGGRVKLAQRISPADSVTVAAHKAGGPLRKGAGGGGGAQSVNNHFYNDGESVFNSMQKWAKLGLA